MARALHDAFICHASEDKDAFVRPLAKILRDNYVDVWYDEFSLRVGDSLRRSIDEGLLTSRFGIVVMSSAFISKEWPQGELDGLVQRQMDEKRNVILPVWHEIDRADVLAFCPPLADKVAVSSAQGLDHVAAQLLRSIKPQGSTLVAAREHLISIGYNPPVVTDDWWLDVVEFSASNDVEGTFQEAMGWGHWGFPLPPRSDDAVERGERLAWAAAQKHWQNVAAEKRISQITHPDELWAFVESQPGLLDTCLDYPSYVAAYAPQVTIPGFGKHLEAVFTEFYHQSLARDPTPDSDDLVALRHPSFDDYDLAILACHYVQGDTTAFGPPVSVYETVDYAVWLLSDAGSWMPSRIHQALLSGMAEWGVWPWSEHYDSDSYGSSEYVPGPSCGALLHELHGARRGGVGSEGFALSQACRADILERLSFSKQLLRLPEKASELVERFLEYRFIEAWLEDHAQRK